MIILIVTMVNSLTTLLFTEIVIEATFMKTVIFLKFCSMPKVIKSKLILSIIQFVLALTQITSGNLFLSKVTRRVHVSALIFVRLCVGATLLQWDCPIVIRELNSLARSCFKKSLVLSLTVTLSINHTVFLGHYMCFHMCL